MTERVLAGVPASPGIAFGAVRCLDASGEVDGTVLDEGARPAAATRALDALARSAQELEALAVKLRADGRVDEADILDAGTMMAEDPVLITAVERAVVDRGLTPASAILTEVEGLAVQLDMLDDPELAARAADVRSLARRASRLASGERGRSRCTAGDAILVRRISARLTSSSSTATSEGSPSPLEASRGMPRSLLAGSGSRWSSAWVGTYSSWGRGNPASSTPTGAS